MLTIGVGKVVRHSVLISFNQSYECRLNKLLELKCIILLIHFGREYSTTLNNSVNIINLVSGRQNDFFVVQIKCSTI